MDIEIQLKTLYDRVANDIPLLSLQENPLLKNEYNMIQRSLYYWSELYEEQLEQGDRYDKLCRTVCINILDFKYLKNDRFHNGYRLKEIETNEELTDLEEIHFIEIPKLQRLNKEQDVVDLLEGWGNYMSDIKNDCIAIQKYIKKSKSTLEIFMYSPAGIGFIIMTPFVMAHKKYFNKVKEYVNILNNYSKKYNLSIKFDEFCELENYAIMYTQSQLGSLTIKQYELRLEYLKNLNNRVEALKNCM